MKKFLVMSLMLVICVSMSAQVYTLCDKWVDCGNNCQLLDPYWKDGVTFTWTGSSVNGKAHGKGVAKKYVNGELESTYEGEYKNGIREGHGKFTHADGSIKEGDFVNGQLMGQGKGDYSEGNEYEGNFINYRMHGKGKLKYGNGTVFEGFLVSDVPYTGKITYYEGTVEYIQAGEVVDKIKEKKSTYSPTLGVVQTEYFDENWERCIPKDAAYYRRVTYKAPNVPDGIVKDFYISGRLQSTFTPVYIDYADEGKTFCEGEAFWYYEDGSVEQHRYHYNNTINGPRTYYYKSGQVASEEYYKYDVMDGPAIYYYEDGNVKEYRLYENGELKDGKCLEYLADGRANFHHYVDFSVNPDYWNYSGVEGRVALYNNNALVFSLSPEGELRAGLKGNIISSTAGGASVSTLRTSKDSEILLSLTWGFRDDENYNCLTIHKDEFMYFSLIRGEPVLRNSSEHCP